MREGARRGGLRDGRGAGHVPVGSGGPIAAGCPGTGLDARSRPACRGCVALPSSARALEQTLGVLEGFESNLKMLLLHVQAGCRLFIHLPKLWEKRGNVYPEF